MWNVNWTRAGIKNYAKDFLRNHYWKAFLVCLIASLLSGGSNTTSNTGMYQDYNDYQYDENVVEESIIKDGEEVLLVEKDIKSLGMPFGRFRRGIKPPLYYLTGGVLSLFIVVTLFLLVTLGLVAGVGMKRFFLDGFRGDVSIGKVFSGFNREEYFPIITTQLLTLLYTFLWTLLFIIPGIIKAYEYSLVPYILAENPGLTANEVITKSRELTRGHKMDMFVLDLSFLGWYFLGALALGIGVLFVNPYKEATMARLYDILSGNAEATDSDPVSYENPVY